MLVVDRCCWRVLEASLHQQAPTTDATAAPPLCLPRCPQATTLRSIQPNGTLHGWQH